MGNVVLELRFGLGEGRTENFNSQEALRGSRTRRAADTRRRNNWRPGPAPPGAVDSCEAAAAGGEVGSLPTCHGSRYGEVQSVMYGSVYKCV